MIGVGNVGEYLTPMDSGSTFLSTDGGVTWKEIKKGVYMWEYGDQGTILVLVDAVQSTDSILYSLDDGKTWNEFKFIDSPLKINDLATVPTDTARKFCCLLKILKILMIHWQFVLILQTFMNVNVN